LIERFASGHAVGQEGTTLNGEAAALIRAGASALAESPVSPQWLIDLKATADEMRQVRERPPGKPFGRWLGDFLDQDTPSGLLPAEEKLQFAAMGGEACVLENRAVLSWATFETWRETMPEAPKGNLGFVEAIAKFTEAAPEPVQDVIIEATRYAIETLRLPAYWEPQSAGDVEKFALAQRAFLARLEAEAHPAQTTEHARKDERFYQLAVEAAIESLTPRPYEPLKLTQEWLNPLLRRDPFNLSADMRAKINQQPRMLRGFFDELLRDVKRSAIAEQDFADVLKADPDALRERFETVFARYERERWRWVDPEDPEVQIRASFLRFLSLGGDDFAPLHESRLELHGASIDEDLDFSGCTVRQPLLFRRCHFVGRIFFRDAVTKSLNFSTSHVQSIDAESAHIRGSVLLRDGFHAAAGVSFPYATIDEMLCCSGGLLRSVRGPAFNCRGAEINGDADMKGGFLGEGAVIFHAATIGGELNCSGSAFRNRTEDGSSSSLDCSNAEIAGNVLLANNFRSEGAVLFSGARIGGALNCRKGAFLNRTNDGTGRALNFEHTEINDGVYVCEGFSAEGQVRLCGAKVKAGVQCDGGRFENAAPAMPDGSVPWTPHAAIALDLRAAKIDGILSLGPTPEDALARADVTGSVNLQGCHAHQIIDHPSSWPSRRVKISRRKLPAFIFLDGFTYDRMAGRGDYASRTRKKWLDRQPPEHLGVNFRPQPFEQLIKVYRESGHNGRARDIAKFKERRRYRSLFVRLWHGWRERPEIFKWRFLAPLNTVAWPFAIFARVAYRSVATVFLAAIWAFVGFGAAYWHGWGRLALFLLALWAAGGLFYREVALQGSFAPSNPVIYLNKDLEAKCSKNWTECKGAPPELPNFSPFTYSLDIMLPVLDLGQKHDWQPIDQRDKPVIMVFPSITWEPGYDLPSDVPHIRIDERPLAEGTVDNIVKAQTLLSWGVLGLLIAMFSRLFKKD
jgi:hypothetical protein